MSDVSKKLVAEAEGWKVEAALCLSEFTPAELEAASVLLRGAAAMKKKIKDFCAPNIKRWYDGHKKAKADEAELLAPVEEAEAIIKEKITKYRTWERRQILLAQEAEQKARRAEEEARRAAEAQVMRDAGEDEVADMIQTAPIRILEMAPPPPAKIEGIHQRLNWSATVTDKMALIQFVAANPIFSHLLDVSMKECNKLAKAQKDNMVIPGLKAVASESTVVRT